MADKEIKEKVAELIKGRDEAWCLGLPPDTTTTDDSNRIHTLYLSYFNEMVEGLLVIPIKERNRIIRSHCLSALPSVRAAFEYTCKAQLKSCQEQIREKLGGDS